MPEPSRIAPRPCALSERAVARLSSAVLCAAVLCSGLLRAATPIAQQQAPQPIAPIEGSLVLAGNGEVPDYVLDAFLHLCGRYDASIAVVRGSGKAKSVARWHGRGARAVLVVGKKSTSAEALTTALLEADGVWFEDAAAHLQTNALFGKLVRNVLARGGVLGGAGEAAVALAEQHGSSGLLQGSRVQLLRASAASTDKDASKRAARVLKPRDGLVAWQIPPRTALIIHHGRRVCALGEGKVHALVAGTKEWPARHVALDAIDAFDAGDRLDYDADLLSWLRSARDRTGPVFPAKKMAPVRLKQGTLLLSGGDGVPSPTWRRFIEAAGGKDALLVCIPTAGGIEPGSDPDSYSQRQLRNHGCTNVVVLHTNDVQRANQDQRLLKPLTKAGGVWIDGGRTNRVMDIYQDTRAHQLMRDVLRRGGVIGGSSAGCQVAGDFLMRGNPRSNKSLVHEGYRTGLGFLAGVILDAHFLQRKRGEAFAGLMQRYPQMLGIGVDEGTALVIVGKQAEVLGRACVSFYDGTNEPVILRQGEHYDLSAKRAMQ